MKYLLITTNNETKELDLENIEDIQAVLDGYFEMVYPQGLQKYCLFVDDEGLLKNKPINIVASYWYGYEIHGQPIVGDVLVSKTNYQGETLSLSNNDILKLNQNIKTILG